MEEELSTFSNACDEFIAGKFIFPETKIAAILACFNDNERLKSLISTLVRNYNFDDIYSSMMENASIDIPTDDNTLIAFVYNLLERFKNKNLRFNDFIARIKTETEGEQFKEFVNSVIVPFKEAVINAFNKIEDAPQVENITPFVKLKTAIKLVLENVDSFKLKMAEKEEFTMLLNSLYLASEKNDKKMVYSLMIGLDYFTKCFKKCRNAYYSLEECFAN